MRRVVAMTLLLVLAAACSDDPNGPDNRDPSVRARSASSAPAQLNTPGLPGRNVIRDGKLTDGE